MATNDTDGMENKHFKNYFASGAINIESIEHVEHLFPGSPEMVEKFLAKKSKSQLIEEKLTEFIHDARDKNKDGKEILAPYVVAFSMGYAPKMEQTEFNSKYGTSISKTTYNNWTSPVFNDTPSKKYSYKDTDLRYYETVFDDLIHAK